MEVIHYDSRLLNFSLLLALANRMHTALHLRELLQRVSAPRDHLFGLEQLRVVEFLLLADFGCVVELVVGLGELELRSSRWQLGNDGVFEGGLVEGHPDATVLGDLTLQSLFSFARNGPLNEKLLLGERSGLHELLVRLLMQSAV